MAFKLERHLVEAIEQCKLNKIVNLVGKGYNIHAQNTLGQNFLMYLLLQQQQDSSLSKKRLRIFQYLVTNYNLNIHLFDLNHKNVFNWATNLNCAAEALYLLNSYPGDIDILERDSSGSCSLHYAVEHGNEVLVHAIVNYLVRYRLRFDIKDAHGNTPEDLSRKLGYEKIANFLAQACQSTVYMSREIPSHPQKKLEPPITNISKSILTGTSGSILGSSSSLIDSSESFNYLKTKTSTGKKSDNCRTTATLRNSTNKISAKNLNVTLDPISQVNTTTSAIFSFSKLPQINQNTQTNGQSEQLLHLMEPQISPSYRQAFIPIYPSLVSTHNGPRRSEHTQYKTSQSSSRRRSSVLSRKRDSEISQLSSSTLQDMQNRFSISGISKSHRPSVITTS